jgi:hypothetical protein
MLFPHGERLDVDKEIKEMKAEERALFNCLEDDSNFSAYEEMDEDWIMNANEGQVAVVPVPEDDNQSDSEEKEEEDFHNKDVHVFEDAEL